MSISSEILLQVLGSTVRSGTPAERAVASSGVPGDEFAGLLEQARAGSIDTSTGLPVAVEPNAEAELSSALTRAELSALSAIADRAQASGAASVAVIRGDEVLHLDVATRRVTAVGALGDQPVQGAEMIALLPDVFEDALSLPGKMMSALPDIGALGPGAMNGSLRSVLGLAGL